jgi:CheY-like chemotaxis protein
MASDHGPHRCSVLIVDDDAELCEVLRVALEAPNVVVLTASNGREALHLLRSHPEVCVVVLDVLMPVMDGEAFRATQLRDRSLHGIPIVAMSGAADGRERARAIGAWGYLRKPLDLDEAREVVRLGCGQRGRGAAPGP